MREILFRGQRTYNGKWVVGNLVVDDDAVYMIGKGEAFNNSCVLTTASKVRIDPETVGQFTGLTDKNGQRIFEGDIIRHKQNIFTIKYFVPQARFLAFLPNGDFDPTAIKYCEVIGNIHDNPELLTENAKEEN